ncbi:thiol reductant ABC exporter subunit CydC [Effusibacillus lacus]|uniref:Thiol reductant ABC exporter subunit CydC n=1 Tax=Effusibacillus lacus TaxID=1348429 RepID=A0A292YPD4_9BACL|nr:thiol reductant ABC exporter subunit CydC [Effusibacillus lacus]TCS72050.1 ATP-binding cassette subfamily C protein CydC [Effusibacillus lacus]GAX90340.1 thiol reductant ABC exporter subunit CydC [Effusibacillus lacus]
MNRRVIQEMTPEDRKTQLSFWRVIVRLFQFQRPFLRRIALSILLSFCTVGANIGLMATSGFLIAKAALHPATVLLLWMPIVGVRFFGLSRAVFRYGDRYYSHDLTFRILRQIREWLYRRIEPLVPLMRPGQQSSDVFASAIGDIETLQNLYLRVIAPPLVAFLAMGLCSVLMAPFGWDMVLALVAGMVSAGAGVPLLTHLLAQRAGAEAVRVRARMQTKLVDSVEGMADVLAYNLKTRVMQVWESEQQIWVSRQLWLAHVDGLGSGLFFICSHLTMWVVLWLGIEHVQTGRLDGVYLAMLVLAALAVFEAVMPMPTAFKQLGECIEAGRRMFRLTDQSPLVPEQVCSLLPRSADLRVRNVSFIYPGSDRKILADISFDLPEGKHMALVGASGAGKSTLIRLLLRFWEPTHGHIELGGVNLCDVEPEAVRRWFTVIEQKTYLFHESAADNLRLGHPTATLTELQDAASKSQIDQVLRALPHGYDTLLGEFGARLSGGERQRLALARALLKEAPILLLDEPTTGLDPIVEQRFMKILRMLAAGRSVLLITHRMSGLESFDEILVLKDGRIAERGTHAELLNLRGIYRAMWEVERDRLHAYAYNSLEKNG